MTITQLNYIITLEKTRNFTKAANLCKVSQPTLSMQIQKLEEELKYTRGFLTSVQKKLANERFVNSAPEQVVALERKKAADAEATIETLEKSLANLT